MNNKDKKLIIKGINIGINGIYKQNNKLMIHNDVLNKILKMKLTNKEIKNLNKEIKEVKF